jgi:hypothetical protein
VAWLVGEQGQDDELKIIGPELAPGAKMAVAESTGA